MRASESFSFAYKTHGLKQWMHSTIFPIFIAVFEVGVNGIPRVHLPEFSSFDRRNFPEQSKPRIYLTAPSAISHGTGSPKLVIFPNLMGSCQGQLASENSKM